MNNELRIIWAYVRAVFGHWWFIIIEVVLVLVDLIERALGTWLLPPRWVRVAIGVAVLVCGALHNEMAVATVTRRGLILLTTSASTLPFEIFFDVLGEGNFRLRPVRPHTIKAYCRDQTWSQWWSQDGMIAGLSVRPTLLVKFKARKNRSSGTQ
jgi:hypothetical protein